MKKNEALRNELTEREEWNKSDMTFAKQTDDNRKLEINKMRNALDEIKNENIRLSQNVVKEHVAKEKIEKFLKGTYLKVHSLVINRTSKKNLFIKSK